MRTVQIKLMIALLFVGVVAAFARQQAVANRAKTPETPVRAVQEVFFGTEITDPYRWLDDLKSPEVSSWMRAQNDYTRAVLDRIPNREKLRARIAQLDDSGVQVNGLQSFAGRLFYLKRSAGDDNRQLYVRDGANGAERLLLNPQTRTENGVHYSIDYFQASPDGKLVAVGISPGGSENSVLHVMDTSTGLDVGASIDRTQFGAVNWLPNSRGFFYNRLRKLGADEPRTSYYLNSRDYLHHVGDDPEKDVAVFGKDLSAGVTITDSDFPVFVAPGIKIRIRSCGARSAERRDDLRDQPR